MREVLDRRLGHVRCAIETLHHRHNVSAVLRTCDALGIHHVHLAGAPFTATTAASRGAERWLALHRHPSVEQAVAAIRADGFRLWVADLAEGAVAPEDVPLDRPVCVWLGAELEGVHGAVRAAADGVVTVPMHGFSQSLNVSVAGALTLRPIAERARALGEAALLPHDERATTLAAWLAREERVDAGARVRARLSLDD
jgi:tRNA (guanosine-2'-O-)-methyltransferase